MDDGKSGSNASGLVSINAFPSHIFGSTYPFEITIAKPTWSA